MSKSRATLGSTGVFAAPVLTPAKSAPKPSEPTKASTRPDRERAEAVTVLDNGGGEKATSHDGRRDGHHAARSYDRRAQHVVPEPRQAADSLI